MRYRKIDLHVHTPSSLCYLDHVLPEAGVPTSAEAIVRAALAQGLQAIAVTDHNTGRGIEGVRQVGNRLGLAVLPGVEISARGGHALALFERDTPVSVITSLLRDLGFKEEEEGDGYFQTSLWLDQVFERIDRAGGLAIAAHIDRQPRGFMASGEALSDKQRIHNSPYLAALEVTNPSSKDLWSRGLAPSYPKKYPCLMGSDAHAPDEIGRRFIYVRLAEVTLASLRRALREHRRLIRFPGEAEVRAS